MGFVHLHAHTQFSLLDGANKITEYVKRVKELGMQSAAITDHGAMYGVIKFYEECKSQGIKPILGCEVYVAPGSRFDKDTNTSDEKYNHLVLLAENNEGFQNLIKIVSIGFTEGFYYKPRVDKEILRKYSKGIIASSACLAGEISRRLTENNYEEAKKAALELEDIFGKGNFFLELQDHGLPIQKNVNMNILKLHKETGIDVIATNDIHYTLDTDANAQDILLCLQTGKKFSDEDRMRYDGGQYYVKSEEEMRTLFTYIPEAIDNTVKIADRCNVDIEFGVTKLPKYDVPDNKDSWEYLKELCYKGIEDRYKNIWEEDNSKPIENSNYYKDNIIKRLEYELDTIHSMGFVDYFLIVSDFINYAKSNGIPVGPGRGSAAGSIVSYSLRITDIDPLKFDLLFERFLNPERVSMPDIDIDFCYERRSEVIEYVSQKYGYDNVVQIVTFGSLLAKGVIRDVVRVLDLPYSFGDKLAKMIPNELKITIDKALEKNPDFKKEYDENNEAKNVIDISKALEGLPRHLSKHAAGVLICGKPAYEYVPLARTPEGGVVAEYDMVTLERLGLLKMDFLGLRTLTVIKNAIQNISNLRGIDIDIQNIPLDDKKTYELISQGKTEGVFQLESVGMRNFMKELKPDTFEDIIAGISLYRPGPMDFIPKYLKGKENKNAIEYECEQLRPILESTYGCIVYQEQVMRIVRDLAGFSMGRSDNLRRAMSKKKADVMEAERKAFLYGDDKENVPGCVKNGISEKVGNRIYDSMISFAAYAFNKSHAAAYAVISYQTAYLKAHYPVEFMSALLTSVFDNVVKLSVYVNACKSSNIKILPPDINTSGKYFEPILDNGEYQIRYALSAVKSVGETVVSNYILERQQNGPIKSYDDFIERTYNIFSKAALENLIKCGALDFTNINRKAMVYMIETAVDGVKKASQKEFEGQINMLDFVSDNDKDKFSSIVPNVDDYSNSEKLDFEKEILGIYISGHPLGEYMDVINKNVTAYASDFFYDETDPNSGLADKTKVVMGAILTNIKPFFTKANKQMAFVNVSDMSGEIEGIVFPRDYEKIHNELFEDAKVIIVGTVSKEEEKDSKIIISKIYPINLSFQKLWIKIRTIEEFNNYKELLKSIEYDETGDDQVIVYVEETKSRYIVSPKSGVKITDELFEYATQVFGEENVEVTEKPIKVVA